jgi:dsDNA-binding SOS-regulon protein
MKSNVCLIKIKEEYILKNEYYIKDKVVYIKIRNKEKKEFETKIDIEDFEKIKELNSTWFTAWYPEGNCYYAKATLYLGKVNGKYKNKCIFLHRFITNANEKEYVDHINHDTLDNTKENLRVVDNSENLRNRIINRNNTTGVRNVSWSKRWQKYYVQFQKNGKNTLFGTFNANEFDKAVELANRLREELYGKINTQVC